MPPSLQIAPPRILCQLGLSTLTGILSASGDTAQVHLPFFFLIRLLSFPRGRTSSGDSPETPPLRYLLLPSCGGSRPHSTCDLFGHLPDPISDT